MIQFNKFKKGWLICDENRLSGPVTDLLEGWLRNNIGSVYIFTAPDLNIYIGQYGETRILCLGKLCDVSNPLLSEKQILAAFAKCLDEYGWEMFYENLINTGGSYILIVDHISTYFFLDATGTIPGYFYDTVGKSFLASHPRLIAEQFGLGESRFSEEWRQHPKVGAGGRYYPGLVTEFDNVNAITPNQRFDIKNKVCERWYPFRHLHNLSPKLAASRVFNFLTNQFIWLKSHQEKLFISLSGGLDTRLTLAMSKKVSHDATYFTYFNKGKILNTDYVISNEMSQSLGIKLLNFPSGSMPDKVFTTDFYYCEGKIRLAPTTLYQIAKHIPDRHIHIRSNIPEFFRGFYLKNKANHKNVFDAQKLSRLFRNSTERKFISEFQNFIDLTNFFSENFYNYHYSDLFYLEHRLACNYGPIYRGHTGCFDTYSIYNSLVILETLLSVNITDRTSASAVFELIKLEWPEVLEFPVFSGSRYLEHSDIKDNLAPIIKQKSTLRLNELQGIRNETTIDNEKNKFKLYVDEKTGIPFSEYGVYLGVNIGRQTSYLSVAERGIYYWNKYLKNKTSKSILLSYCFEKTWPVNRDTSEPHNAEQAGEFFFNCANYLLDNITDKESFSTLTHNYPFAYDTKADWSSCHTQAMSMLCLALAYSLTEKQKYLKHLPKLTKAFLVPIHRGGLLQLTHGGYFWYEKFSSTGNRRPMVLNGMMFALLALNEVYRITKDKDILPIFNNGFLALKKHIKHFDLNNWSAYDIYGKKASLHYHQIHIKQLEQLLQIRFSFILWIKLKRYSAFLNHRVNTENHLSTSKIVREDNFLLPRVSMIVWNEFLNDARVLKEAQTLQAAGFQVTVHALHTPLARMRETLNCGTKVVRVTRSPLSKWHKMCKPTSSRRFLVFGYVKRLSFIRSLLRVLAHIWTHGIFLYRMVRFKPDVVHSHDANTLPTAWLASLISRAPLVYDVHEACTYQEDYASFRNLVDWMEKKLIPSAVGIITNSDIRSKFFASVYGVSCPLVLQDCPRLIEIPRNDKIRQQLKLEQDWPIVLYQGDLQQGRGLEQIVDVAHKIENAYFVFIGGGRLELPLKDQVSRLNLGQRVYFIDTVVLDDLPHYTASADIGVQAIENTCPKHYSTGNNELFEYMMAGLPVVASNVPENRKIIEKFGFGITVPPGDAATLCQTLKMLIDDPELRRDFSEKACIARLALNWGEQEPILLGLYEQIMKKIQA